jgi:hypothetical protein
MEELSKRTNEERPKAKRAYKQRKKLSPAEKAIAKLEKAHKFVRLDILKALRGKECSPGTNSRLAYLKALQQLEIDYVDQITKMGVLPKNVQAQTTAQYVFKAHLTSGGNVTTVPVSSAAQVRELERIESKEMKKGYFVSDEDEAIRAELEAEFGEGGTAKTTKE